MVLYDKNTVVFRRRAAETDANRCEYKKSLATPSVCHCQERNTGGDGFAVF